MGQISTDDSAARWVRFQPALTEADLRGWLPVMEVNLSEEEIGSILDEAESVLAEYVANDGHVTFDTSAHLVTAGTP